MRTTYRTVCFYYVNWKESVKREDFITTIPHLGTELVAEENDLMLKLNNCKLPKGYKLSVFSVIEPSRAIFTAL